VAIGSALPVEDSENPSCERGVGGAQLTAVASRVSQQAGTGGRTSRLDDFLGLTVGLLGR
jgi:hypothetical protein